MVKAIRDALEMPASAIADRNRRNLEFSTKLTINMWAIQVLHDLMSVEKTHVEGQENFGTRFSFTYYLAA